jgi:hypothetical protein
LRTASVSAAARFHKARRLERLPFEIFWLEPRPSHKQRDHRPGCELTLPRTIRSGSRPTDKRCKLRGAAVQKEKTQKNLHSILKKD